MTNMIQFFVRTDRNYTPERPQHGCTPQ